MMDLGVHLLDLVLFLCHFPKAGAVLANTYGGFTRYDTEDFGCAEVRLDGDLSLFLCASSFSHVEQQWEIVFEILGSRAGARIRVRPDGETFMIFKEEKGLPVDLKIDERLYHSDAFNRHLQHFVDCIRTDKRPISCSPEEGVRLMKILMAIYTSARKGRAVTFS
jgi:predicted dehydrogenase